MRLTELAHELLCPHLKEGCFVIDGTAGKGHDTLFLARAVGPAGSVIAFDPQPAALAATQARLAASGVTSEIRLTCGTESLLSYDQRVTLLLCGHENAPRLLNLCPPLQAVVLNLGYLPGADHAITTTADKTVSFLNWAAAQLTPGGVLSVLAYRSHPGGEEEAQTVASLAGRLNQLGWSHQTFQGPPGLLPSPVLHHLQKPAGPVAEPKPLTANVCA